MHLPAEIVRIILNYASRPWKPAEFLKFRLVNSDFDEQALLYIFAHRYFRLKDHPSGWNQTLKPSTWASAPRSLQQRYLHYRVTQTNEDSGYFPCLFIPVFDRHIAKLDIHDANSQEYNDELRKCLEMTMHDKWNQGSIVTHWASNNDGKRRQVYPLGGFHCSPELEFYCPGASGEEMQAKRTDNDVKFLEILLGILSDNEEAVLDAFPGSYIAVDDLNWCFGTTLLGFAIARGTLSMLKLLLRSVKSIRVRYLIIYIKLALSRGDGSQTFVNTLLDHLSGFDTYKKIFTRKIFPSTFHPEKQPEFNAIMTWLATAEGFPDKFKVLEWLYWRIHRRSMSNLQISPPNPNAKRPEPSDDLPDHMYTKEYQKYIKVAFGGTNVHNIWYESLFDIAGKSGFAISSIVHLAVWNNKLAFAEWLLWAGADPRHLEGDVSILDLAVQMSDAVTVAQLLRKWGWNVEELEVERPGAKYLERVKEADENQNESDIHVYDSLKHWQSYRSRID